jgi:DNA gyrase subunit B
MKRNTMPTVVKPGYNAASIQVNSDVEGVRSNPTIYITTNDSYGMWICLREIIDNARDEARAEGTTVHVRRLSNPLSFTVYDDGRGMPIDMHPKEKKTGIELIFCKLNAGAKMQHGEGTAYKKATGGVHGMGACITNALSTTLTAYTYRNKKWHEFTCNKGVPQPLKALKSHTSPTRDDAGTEVAFTLDPKFFEPGSKIETETIIDYLKLQSEFYPNLKFVYADGPRTETFYNKLDLGKQLANRYAVPEKDVFAYSKDGLHAALAFVEDNGEKIDYVIDRMYACGMPTPDGGTHWDGLVAAVAYCLPTKQQPLAQIVASLMAGVLNVEVDKPKFASQTKRKLRNSEVGPQVANALGGPLRTFFGKHKPQLADLIDRAKAVDDMMKRHEKEAKLVKAVGGGNGKINLPAKLVRAPNARPEDRELYIVEGESALGVAKKARFAEHQEILPLTGKILNVIKSSEKAGNNIAVQRVLRSIGYTTSKNTDSLRVKNKILFLVDSDADGGHIALLLLGMMQQFLPQAFEEGLIYIIDTPLYKYQSPTEQEFGNSLLELQRNVKKFNPAYVSRMKGWGECDPMPLRKIAFADTRKLIRVLPMQPDERETFYGLLEADSKLRRQVLNASPDAPIKGAETPPTKPKVKIPTFKKNLTPQQKRRVSFKISRKARKAFT